MKAGLVALAETYGLERSQQQRIKELAEELFEYLREGLSELIASPVKLVRLEEARVSFAEFCASSNAGRVLIYGEDEQPFYGLRIEGPLRRILLETLLGRSSTQDESPNGLPLTRTESRLLDQILGDCVAEAVHRAFGVSAATKDTEFKLLATREGESGASQETFAPDEAFLTFAGRLSLNGCGGILIFGLPQRRALEISAQPDEEGVPEFRKDGGRERVRTFLRDVSIALQAVLGTTELSLEKVRALKPGSLIPFGRIESRSPEILLCAADICLARGTIVADRGWYRFLLESQEKPRGQSEHRNAA